MKLPLLLLSFLFSINLIGQSLFEAAYNAHPSVPKGLLEAVAWTNTHMVHLSNEQESCTGMPEAYGIMGLFDNGKNYFNENGVLVAQLSGITVNEQKLSPENQIMAYAAAFEAELQLISPYLSQAHNIQSVLNKLSEIPDSGEVNQLARDMQVYSILKFMNSFKMSSEYGFVKRNFNLRLLFGEENYSVLSAKQVLCTSQGVKTTDGHTYIPPTGSLNRSSNYGPAIWNAAASCNYSSRNGTAVSAITIHTVQGTYAGCISWFQNCSASVSAHYVVRSSDGQITQMVDEADKAWHVGSENPYTIGYEHEGYVSDPSWYTEAMYTASADLSKDIVNSGYGINPLRTFDGPATSGINTLGACIKIKGHQHYPNQTHTDPGINWNWEHYYQLINDPYIPTLITSPSGTLYDTGGPSNDYSDDERPVWLIQPASAQTITLDFTAFDLETNWDYLYIYDGDTITSPLIGMYTGTSSPGTVISSGNSLLLEFRSDCNTTAPGWEANYSATTPDATPPITSIVPGTVWHTDDFNVDFTDSDVQSGVDKRFYLAAPKTVGNNDWNSAGSYGFAYESFEDGSANWWNVTGTYTASSGTFVYSDSNEQNSNVYMSVDQNNSHSYLFEWDQTITSTVSNQRAGMHFFCDNPNLPNRGNSYFIYLRENDDKLQIYSVDNDIFNLEADIPFTVNANQSYNCKTFYNPVDGEINVYIDDSLIGSWQDITPLPSGAFISLRTGGCEATFDNIHVYQLRGSNVTISAGVSDLFNVESEGAVPTGMVRSLALDSAGNWSTPAIETYLLDFTAPEVNYLNDGAGTDIDTFYTSTIEANWDIFDIHSDIADFTVAIGTLPNLDDVYPWTTNGLSNAFSYVLGNPVYNQVYYISVKALNQAGLQDQFMCDGQRLVNDQAGMSLIDLKQIRLYPNPANEFIVIEGISEGTTVDLFDMQGKLVKRIHLPSNGSIDVSGLSKGSYNVMIYDQSSFIIKQLIKQ